MFGERIKELREQKGLSVAAFADLVGVCRQTVYLWESSSSIPSFSDAVRIASALNCSTDDLVVTESLIAG